MDDLISRQAAIDEANAWLLDCLKVNKQDRSCGLIRRLEDLPSAQPEPKKGAWINEGRIIRCNRCKIGYATVKGMKSALTYKFCPNCGVDMRTARQIVHDAIDNTPMAEDVYPGIKERLHKAVDDMREVTT